MADQKTKDPYLKGKQNLEQRIDELAQEVRTFSEHLSALPDPSAETESLKAGYLLQRAIFENILKWAINEKEHEFLKKELNARLKNGLFPLPYQRESLENQIHNYIEAGLKYLRSPVAAWEEIRVEDHKQSPKAKIKEHLNKKGFSTSDDIGCTDKWVITEELSRNKKFFVVRICSPFSTQEEVNAGFNSLRTYFPGIREPLIFFTPEQIYPASGFILTEKEHEKLKEELTKKDIPVEKYPPDGSLILLAQQHQIDISTVLGRKFDFPNILEEIEKLEFRNINQKEVEELKRIREEASETSFVQSLYRAHKGFSPYYHPSSVSKTGIAFATNNFDRLSENFPIYKGPLTFISVAMTNKNQWYADRSLQKAGQEKSEEPIETNMHPFYNPTIRKYIKFKDEIAPCPDNEIWTTIGRSFYHRSDDRRLSAIARTIESKGYLPLSKPKQSKKESNYVFPFQRTINLGMMRERTA